MSARVTDEELVAYADGALAPEAAERVRAAVAADPALAARLAALRESGRVLREAFAPIAEEPVPARLVAAVLAADAASAAAPPVPANAPRRWWPAAAAAAVAFVVGLGSGMVLAPRDARGPIAVGPAPAALARVLEAVPSGEEAQAEGLSVRPVATHATPGGPCRAVVVAGGAMRAQALACRADDGWMVRAVLALPSGEGFTPASAEHPALAALLAGLGASEALDEAAERAAIARRWR